MRPRYIAPLLAALLLLTGCSVVFDIVNKRGLKSDLNAFFQEKGLSVPLKSCKMVQGSRSGYCFTSAGEQELQELIQVFNLQPENLTGLKPMDFARGCGSAMKADRLYISWGNRPENLRIGPGKAFDYLYVSTSTKNTKSCIQTSFSFG
jgi:hypothetical protein